MGPSLHLIVPDSSVKALITQQRSSSSPTSSLDSPNEPSLPAASPSQHLPHTCTPHLDPSLPSSSSSLSSLVPEIAPVSQSECPQYRRRKKQRHSHKRDKHDGTLDGTSQERSERATCRRDSAGFRKKKKGIQDNMCCKCAAAFTADCAAVCCCPLALLHLAALMFVRLPTAVVWKMLVSMKNKLCTKGRSPKESDEDSPRPNFANPWSNGSSPGGRVEPGAQVGRIDSENLWQHFEAGSSLDFGGISMR